MNEHNDITINDHNDLNNDNLKQANRNTDLHKILLHNCTGFSTYHHSFFESDVSFILLQETWHLPSTKIINDTSMNFTKFAVSAIDEEQESRVTLKGGLITYVNNRIQEQTKVIKSCTEYLVTQTGNLVLINCYLPQQGRFYTDGRYVTAVDEIIEVVDTLGPEMTYIIAGDFNSNGPNLPQYHRLKETLNLADLSSHRTYV